MTAEGLEEIAGGFQHYASVLRGDVQDLTGLGAWEILCNQVTKVTGYKMITLGQYEDYKRLSDEDYERRGGRKSY